MVYLVESIPVQILINPYTGWIGLPLRQKLRYRF